MEFIKRGLEFIKEKKKNYAAVCFTFRILLGLIYLSIFISLLLQIKELISSTGLLPIAELVKSNPNLSYFDFPTLHLFFNNDFSLYLILLIGIIFSILLALGYIPRTSLIACLAIYLSYIASGRDFFYFQWDNLLLESSFLAFFLPLNGRLMGKKELREPSIFSVFLFRWLLFRLYFESSLAKLIYGKESWLNLTAMTYYYETAPLPNFGGWIMQQLMPNWFHITSVFATFFMELIVPFMLFYPRKARIVSFYLLAFFNFIIFLTSNFGFFNFLSVFIGIFLLDDEHLLGFSKIKSYFKDSVFHNASDFSIKSSALLVIFIVPFSIIEFAPFAKPDLRIPEPVAKIQDLYQPFRLVNRYHLFPDILKERIVIEFYGGNDLKTWEQFKFKYTPNDEKQTPPWLILHQARFAFQYSFVTLGQLNAEYFRNLVVKTCKSPEDIQDLFVHNLNEKPKYLRLDFYRYKFSDPNHLFGEGKWWVREYKGSSQIIECRQLQQ